MEPPAAPPMMAKVDPELPAFSGPLKGNDVTVDVPLEALVELDATYA